MKVPVKYFIDSENKFHITAYDRFQMYAMSELTESQRIMFIPDSPYLHAPPPHSDCKKIQTLYYRYLAKNQTPLLPLKSFNDEVRCTQDYSLRKNLTSLLAQHQGMYEECKKKG